MNYQRIVVCGNVSADAQLRSSKKGDVQFLTFSIAVSDGKNKTTFFLVVVFGKLAESLSTHIPKGRQLLVEGRIEQGENRFNVVADKVVLGSKPAAAKDNLVNEQSE